MAYGKKHITAYDEDSVEYVFSNVYRFEECIGSSLSLTNRSKSCKLWGYNRWFIPTAMGLKPHRVQVNPREFAYILRASEPVLVGTIVFPECLQATCVEPSHLIHAEKLFEVKWKSLFDPQVISRQLASNMKGSFVPYQRSIPRGKHPLKYEEVLVSLSGMNIKSTHPQVLPRLRANYVIDVDGCWIWTRPFVGLEPMVRVEGYSVSVRLLLRTLKVPTPSLVQLINDNQESYPACLNDACINPDHSDVRPVPPNRYKGYPADVQVDPSSGMLFVVRQGAMVMISRKKGRPPKGIILKKAPKMKLKEIKARRSFTLEDIDDLTRQQVYDMFLLTPNYDEVAKGVGLTPSLVAKVVLNMRARDRSVVVGPYDPKKEGSIL